MSKPVEEVKNLRLDMLWGCGEKATYIILLFDHRNRITHISTLQRSIFFLLFALLQWLAKCFSFFFLFAVVVVLIHAFLGRIHSCPFILPLGVLRISSFYLCCVGRICRVEADMQYCPSLAATYILGQDLSLNNKLIDSLAWTSIDL